MLQIAFYKGKKKILNKLIAWWTKGDYSHVELVINGVCYSSSMQDGGVRKKQIDLDNSQNWDVFQLNGFDQQAAYNWFEANLGKGYDYIGLVHFVFPSVYHNENRFFCSEAIAKSLGIPEARSLSPNSLFTLLDRKQLISKR